TGKKITDHEISLTVATSLAACRIVIDAPFSDIGLSELDFFGAYGDDLPLYPTPAKSSLSDKTVDVTSFNGYQADNDAANRAGEILAEKLLEKTGYALTAKANGTIRFKQDAAIAENGYRLNVTEKNIDIAAADFRGFVIAVETLIKMLRGNSFQQGIVEDAPRFNFRGVHIFLPPPDQFDFAKRLIKYLISPMGYNAVILEFAGGMRFESHPEITEAVLHAKQMAREGKWPQFPHGEVGGDGVVEKADVAAYIDYIRSFGIDVIPEVQSLGHVQFMTIAHPDIAEREESLEEAVDQRFADANKGKFYAHCYCPSNEKSYKILFDLMDEIIEVARPTKYVHAGHDEVYQIGVCPVCREKDPADLYYNDVMRIHDHLAAKGLKMMIWSDMLQSVSSYKTVSAIDRLPKDIVMMDFIWYFHLGKDIEENLTEKGFPVLIGNLYSSHFPRFEKRVQNPRIFGGEMSFWTRVSEEVLGREGKIYDLFFTAEMLWSDTYHEALRFSYDRVIRRLIPPLRDLLGDRQSPSQLPAHQETALYGTSQSPDPEKDKTGLDIAVNGRFDSLVISHAAQSEMTRMPWVALEEIGAYHVMFDDGSSELIPVLYGGNIGYWNRRQGQPQPQPYYRHNGYIGTYFADTTESRLRDGRLVTLYHYEWLLPQNGKTIVRLRYIPAANAKSDVVVYGVTGLNC
ncbi:MAG: family 20 glycosylhydrolase, partial [Victivallales bacterium]|nr:family 20 glycosylhydrolase [Victivallales bacterium]